MGFTGPGPFQSAKCLRSNLRSLGGVQGEPPPVHGALRSSALHDDRVYAIATGLAKDH